MYIQTNLLSTDPPHTHTHIPTDFKCNTKSAGKIEKSYAGKKLINRQQCISKFASLAEQVLVIKVTIYVAFQMHIQTDVQYIKHDTLAHA